MMTSSRRQWLRSTVAATGASLIGLPALLDTLFLPASAAEPSRRAARGMQKQKGFVHAGILHSADDLKAIRERIRSGAEPWKTAWDRFRADKVLIEGVPKPVAQVYRGPYARPDIGSTEIQHDCGAAYGHALLAAVSPDRAESEAHYRQAIAYLDAWSGTLRSIEGHDQRLLCGLTGYKFAAAAELILHAGNAPQGLWTEERTQAVKHMLIGIFLPPIRDLFPEANGNWDAAMVTTILSIAIVCDDHSLFAYALDLYLNSGGNGAVTNYVYPSGQIEETTRDQGHVQMGIGLLATACRIAWVQGVDLYSAADNRLARGFEYTAKYNLGEDVPCDGGVPGPGARGKLAPIYESVYQHYAVEKGLPMPYTRRIVEQKRPEGYNGAFPSWGTLTTCRVATPHAAPGDLLANTLAAALPPKNGEREITVTSPSHRLIATIGVRGGKLTYSLKDKAGRELLRPSTAGVAFSDGIPDQESGLALWEVASSHRQLSRSRLFIPRGNPHSATVRTRSTAPLPLLPFEQRMLTLRETAAPHRILRAEFRVYDTGIALRLTLPPNRDPGTKAKTATERTRFTFPNGTVVSTGASHATAITALKSGIRLPVTVRVGMSGPYLSVFEVDETTSGTPETLLFPSPDAPNTLVTEASGPIPVVGEASTPFPWRVLLLPR